MTNVPLASTPSFGDGPRTLIIPTHPGVQYHFCRVGLPTYFLGHWDQFHNWRPQPGNVHNVLPRFEDEHLDYGPEDYARLLADPAVDFPARYQLAWLMFNWQYKLLREETRIPKVYRVAKVAELERTEWDELLARPDFTVVSFYPNTVAWLKATYGVDVPYIPLGLDPDAYNGWTGEDPVVLSVIHSWRDRGWHYRDYTEAAQKLPTLHVDHLDPAGTVYQYTDIQRVMRRSRVYLHDGEQEYTITLIEAMMTGMPLVSFALPGIERYVVHGHNGFVAHTAAEVRAYCNTLLTDLPLAEAMGARSRAMALRDHNEVRWQRDWRDVIGRFMARVTG